MDIKSYHKLIIRENQFNAFKGLTKLLLSIPSHPISQHFKLFHSEISEFHATSEKAGEQKNIIITSTQLGTP